MRFRPTLLAVAAVLLVAAACAGPGPGAGGTDAAGGPATGADPGDLLIAGAADLQPAFTLLGESFEDETGIEVAFDFGSSGQIAQRIIEGQPVDLFASADAGFVDRVLAAGVGDSDSRRTYAVGRIVLWSDADRFAGWTSLADVAADDEVRNVAIANPEHAPYGTAGQQALAATGTLDDLDGRLVFGENIADTQRLIETGNADVGIIALSLALAADERDVGAWFLLDEDLHEPLQQDLVVTASDAERAQRARRFVDHVDGEAGRAVMHRFGFLRPDEERDG